MADFLKRCSLEYNSEVTVTPRGVFQARTKIAFSVPEYFLKNVPQWVALLFPSHTFATSRCYHDSRNDG